MWKIALAGLRAHRRRLIAVTSAVVIGVAFLSGTLMLGDSMAQGFDRLFASLHRGTDVVVRSDTQVGDDESAQRAFVDAGMPERVRAVPGVARAAGSLEGVAQLVASDGERLGGDGPPTLAGNWVDDAALNPFRLTSGAAPSGSGEVVVDAHSARTGDLSVGDTVTVLTPEPVPMRISGTATLPGRDDIGGATWVWFGQTDARRYLAGGQDRWSSVLVAAAPGVEDTALADRVARVLPDGVEAVTGSALAREEAAAIDADFLGVVRTFLVVFSGIAVLVAAFSIHNTFSVIAAQRRRESALLRALGATRGQVLRSLAVETLVMGIVASAVGLGVGTGLAVGLGALLGGLGLGIPDDGLVVSSTSLWVSFVVGVVTTVAAGLSPALRSSRVAPLAALRDVEVDAGRIGLPRLVTGWTLVLGGLVVSCAPAVGLWDGPIWAVGAGAAATLFGLIVVSPALARPVASGLGAPVRRLRGVSGVLASQNAVRNPRRTATTSSALLVGVGVVTLFMVFGASLTSWVDNIVAGSLRADLVVVNDSFGGAGLSPELPAALRDAPAVSDAVALATGGARLAGRDTSVTVTDPARLDGVLDVGVRAGGLAEVGGDGMAVDDGAAADRGWRIGSRVPVRLPDGTARDLTVRAIYEDGEFVGPVVLPDTAWNGHGRAQVDLVLVAGRPGVATGELRRQVDGVAEASGAPAAKDRDAFAAVGAEQVDQVLTMVYVLLALSIVIALMGITNTLALAVHERTRELGLLRAVGQTRGQVRSMVRWESVLIAVFGTLLGLTLGVVSGWALVRSAFGDDGGSFSAPASQLGVIAALGAVVGVVAGWRPARRAARLDPLRAIATN